MDDALFETPGCICPICKGALTLAAGLQAQCTTPCPGDITICPYCTAVLRFDSALSPAKMTADDMAELEEETLSVIVQHLRAVRQANAARAPKP